MFRDRAEAGEVLVRALKKYHGTDIVVVALPRGGVVLGYAVAQALGAPLDIVAPRKIGHPLHPEFAIGAVDENGMRIVDESVAKDVDPKWLEEEALRQEDEAKRRIARYRGGRDKIDLAGKTILIIDDGIATGLTMRLAVRGILAERPKSIVVAVPVAPPDVKPVLKKEGVDDVVILEAPESFRGAVGAHYDQFPQVTDQQVIDFLGRIARI